MKRFFALLLLLILLLSLLVSCQQDGAEGNGDVTVQAPGDSQKEPVPNYRPSSNPGYLNDRVPEGEALEALGFAGKTVNILSWEKNSTRTFPKELSDSDPLQYKLYYHWRGVEERLSIFLHAEYTDSETEAKDTFLTDARADAATYDLIQTQSLFPITLAMEGRLCNLGDIGYPDLEMPWWSDDLEKWTCNNALYFVSTNSSVMGLSNLSVILINESMIEQKNITSPVESVVRGTWTVEEMTAIAKRFAGEAENATEANQIYGLVVDDPSRMAAFYYTSNFSSVVKSSEGDFKLGYDEEKELQAISDAIAKFEDLISGSQTKIHDSASYTEMKENRTAMLLGAMYYMEDSEAAKEYVPIPLPVLDAKQYDVVGYRTAMGEYADVWCIPTTTSDDILSGIVLEANASSEYRIIGPCYYEYFLNKNYTNRLYGRQCFEILRDSVVFDLGRIGRLEGLGVEDYWNACFYTAKGKDFHNTFRESYEADGNAATAQDLQRISDSFAQYAQQ